MEEKIRVLVVDDSALMRRVIKEIIETDSGMEVVGLARDGEEAIVKALELRPDVITMDINMPKLDGITSMQYILEELPDTGVLMISSLTAEGAAITFEALELGAFDYVAKPSGTVSANLYKIGKEILDKIRATHSFSRKQRVRKKILANKKPVSTPPTPKKPSKPGGNSKLSKVVVIGVSTGGPGTLMEIVPYLPKDLPAAVVIVQHMPPAFTKTFAQRLNDSSPLFFKEGAPGDPLQNGRGYIAPGGYQLVFKREGYFEYGLRLATTPLTTFMPSVNITMEAALETFGAPRTIGVLLTGMGNDGAEAMVKITQKGGITIAEDETTAVVFGMPREAIVRGGARIVAPSYKIAEEIIKAVEKY